MLWIGSWRRTRVGGLCFLNLLEEALLFSTFWKRRTRLGLCSLSWIGRGLGGFRFGASTELAWPEEDGEAGGGGAVPAALRGLLRSVPAAPAAAARRRFFFLTKRGLFATFCEKIGDPVKQEFFTTRGSIIFPPLRGEVKRRIRATWRTCAISLDKSHFHRLDQTSFMSISRMSTPEPSETWWKAARVQHPG